MNVQEVLSAYENFKSHPLKDRFFKHHDLLPLIESLPPVFENTVAGYSVEDRSIYSLKWGTGKTRVLLWSQMHGDEATGTMAMFDLFNFLQTGSDIVQQLYQACELHFMPMVNPDGAARFTRRNAQQIDINRDYLQTLSPEACLLKAQQEALKPAFGFNLHDQLTLWSVNGSLKPATLSFLAPAVDAALHITPARQKAMLVIAGMFKTLSPLLPGQIGLFDDEFEPRAFGDNFQQRGTSTILIEAGGFQQDPEKQAIRKYYFLAMLSGLHSIATGRYQHHTTDDYFMIPKNNKQLFHILIHQLPVNGITTSIGLNYEEKPEPDGLRTTKIYSIQDIGDLRFCDAYQVFSAEKLYLKGELIYNERANFELFDKNERLLCFRDGKLY